MHKPIIITALLLATAATAAAAEPLWLRDVSIAPDGHTIAFCYKGDIYTVPTAGGRATALTAATGAYQSNPVWSPDSRTIAFASDRNGGGFDIYTVSALGGTPRRLTYNSAAEIPETFTPDGRAVLFSASIQDPATSALFPSARLTELYSVAADGSSAPRQILATPARYVSYLPGTDQFLYQDVKGFEDQWRKHHTSSVTRDIWLYNPATGNHTNLTDRPGENTNPVAGTDGQFYFLSERDGSQGTVNVYQATIADPSDARPLTKMKDHPVRFLSRAADGTLAFAWDGSIYTLTPGGRPAKVAIDLIADDTPDIEKITVRSGAKGAVPSPDGKTIAFTYRGDIFVTSVEYSTTRRVTDTPAAEADLSWSPDGKALYFTSERDGRYNIYKATLTRPAADPDWAHATAFTVEPLFKADSHERLMPSVSPDGKQLAFILDRHILAVKDLDSGRVRHLTDGSTYLQNDGRFSYTWSPDSRWIALEIIARKHDPYTDIALVNTADGTLTNLTNSGYFDAQPRFVMGGNAIAFASERYGMRNHASWGSLNDVMLVFLNRPAYDQWLMSKEDYELASQAAPKDKDKDKPIEVDLNRITDRIARVTPMSTDLTDYTFTDDGALYYLVDTPDGKQIWKYDRREDEHKLITTVSGATGFETTPDGKNTFLVGSTLRKFKDGKLTPISYSGTMTIDHAAERAAMYDNMTREVAARFYRADMHGVDWPRLTDHYRRFLPHINNNHDYAELLSELLGELNVSHTGARYSAPSTSQADRTASLGLLFDLTYTGGPGLRVAEVVEDSPFDRASSAVRPGTVITSVAGTPIDTHTDIARLLADLAGTRTLVEYRNPGVDTTAAEVIKPISNADFHDLLYRRWVKSRAAAVDSLSGGRLGYVHIESMDDASFRRVYSDVLGKYNDREGIVIDIRWNGGGRLHEDIEVLFSGQKYFTQEIRGTQSCDMPSRRWNKPSIMVMSEACYSNAHGTPWVYSRRGLGKLVGMPVPGTMTSVNWVRMQDPTMVFGIPVVGYRLPDGSFLENQQLEPDYKVANDPADAALGTDAQLQTAVSRLLEQIDARK